jgi:hypothetical protein
MNARVVYLGEAEQVPVRDDKELELEIVKNLHKHLSLAIEAFIYFMFSLFCLGTVI